MARANNTILNIADNNNADNNNNANNNNNCVD